MIGAMAALTKAEQDRVLAATQIALASDAPNAAASDIAEFMYQMATIAGARWMTIPSDDASLLSAIRRDKAYQSILKRLTAKGTVYADTGERALSPYAILDRVGGVSGGISEMAPIGIGAIAGYFLFGRKPVGALIGAAIGYFGRGMFK
jgi:hypothetical protein